MLIPYLTGGPGKAPAGPGAAGASCQRNQETVLRYSRLNISEARVWRGLAILLAVAIAGCQSMAQPIETPVVRLLSLSLVGASLSEQRFGVRLLVENPNAVPIPVDNFDFEVRLGGAGILSGRSLAGFTLPAGGQEIVTAEVSSDLVASVSRLFALVQGPDDGLVYELTGRLNLRGAFRPPLNFYARGEVPLSMSGTGP
jgi:LEA14-like dessication related protein